MLYTGHSATNSHGRSVFQMVRPLHYQAEGRHSVAVDPRSLLVSEATSFSGIQTYLKRPLKTTSSAYYFGINVGSINTGLLASPHRCSNASYIDDPLRLRHSTTSRLPPATLALVRSCWGYLRSIPSIPCGPTKRPLHSPRRAHGYIYFHSSEPEI